MSLEKRIGEELKEAMKARDTATVTALRAVKTAITLALTEEGRDGGLSETEELKLLQKLVKQRKDSLEIYRQQDRTDLAEQEAGEIAVIERYLPEQMDESELREVIKAIVAQTGASSMADMGKIMGAAMAKVSGKADGKMISSIAKELLQ